MAHAGFAARQAEQAEGPVALLGVLLGATTVLALVGLANLLSLSAVERADETAVLRIVGMTRGQVRASLLWEAAGIAVVGATTGLVSGWGVGYALLGRARGQGFDSLVVPAGTLAATTALVVVGAVLGAAPVAWWSSRTADAAAVTTEGV